MTNYKIDYNQPEYFKPPPYDDKYKPYHGKPIQEVLKEYTKWSKIEVQVIIEFGSLSPEGSKKYVWMVLESLLNSSDIKNDGTNNNEYSKKKGEQQEEPLVGKWDLIWPRLNCKSKQNAFSMKRERINWTGKKADNQKKAM